MKKQELITELRCKEAKARLLKSAFYQRTMEQYGTVEDWKLPQEWRDEQAVYFHRWSTLYHLCEDLQIKTMTYHEREDFYKSNDYLKTKV